MISGSLVFLPPYFFTGSHDFLQGCLRPCIHLSAPETHDEIRDLRPLPDFPQSDPTLETGRDFTSETP